MKTNLLCSAGINSLVQGNSGELEMEMRRPQMLITLILLFWNWKTVYKKTEMLTDQFY